MELRYLNSNVAMIEDLRQKYSNYIEDLKQRQNSADTVMETVHELQIDMIQNFIHDLSQVITTMSNNTAHMENCIDIIKNFKK
tara:strand:- start:80 stop:328 length:249 start_codon:yes stop_codon:yes gene_type:complete